MSSLCPYDLFHTNYELRFQFFGCRVSGFVDLLSCHKSSGRAMGITEATEECRECCRRIGEEHSEQKCWRIMLDKKCCKEVLDTDV